MKKILLWSLILIMGSCAVTKDDEPDGGGEDGGFKDAFIKALGILPILDSDGEMLVGKKIGPLYYIVSDGGTPADNRFILSKALSASQATYRRNGVTGFIGLGLVDGKAFIYKKGTVEVWGTEAEVDFDKPEHKLEDSAKGEFIILAKGLHFLDNENLEMKADGNLYFENVQKYTHVKNVVDPTRALSKMHAIYKKGNAEFMGIKLEQIANTGVHIAFFYRPNKGATYWPSADDVAFDDTHKFSPLDDFITDATGTYDIFDYQDEKLMFREGAELQVGTGDIVSGDDTYTIAAIKEEGKAIYSSDSKFIGVKLEGEGANKKLILYKDGRKTEWSDIGNVSFEADHKVTDEDFILDLIKNTFTGDSYALGSDLYKFKEKANGSADLYIGIVLTYEHFQNFVDDEKIVSTIDVIYKMATDTKYAGVRFNTNNNTIEYYLDGKTAEWDSPESVIFSDDHKVAAVDSWDPLGKINLMDRGGAFWPTGVVDNSGNFYVAFQDGGAGKGSVIRFDKDTQLWDTDFWIQATDPSAQKISANFMAIDSDDNMYWVYHNYKDPHNLGIQRYDAATESWANFAHAVDGNTDTPTELLHVGGTGVDYVKGHYPNIAINTNDNDAKYIVHGGDGGKLTVRKYNETSKKWEVHGSNGEGFMTGAGMKRIAFDLDNNLYVATANTGQLGGLGDIRVWKMAKDTDIWVAVANPTTTKTAHIDLKFDALDNLYLAFRNGSKVSVKKLNADGITWDSVGGDTLPQGVNSLGEFVTLGFYSDNTPIVATFGDNPARAAYVYKLEGGEWETIGASSQAADAVGHGSMTIDTSNNSIYILYADKSADGAGGMTIRRHIR